MPMNCSAEMFEAMREEPMAQKGSDFEARK